MVLVLVTPRQWCHAATANTLKNSNSAFFLEGIEEVPVLQTSSSRSLSRGALPLLQ